MIAAPELLKQKIKLDDIEYDRLLKDIELELVNSHDYHCLVSLTRLPSHSINVRLYDYLTSLEYNVVIGDGTIYVSIPAILF